MKERNDATFVCALCKREGLSLERDYRCRIKIGDEGFRPVCTRCYDVGPIVLIEESSGETEGGRRDVS